MQTSIPYSYHRQNLKAIRIDKAFEPVQVMPIFFFTKSSSPIPSTSFEKPWPFDSTETLSLPSRNPIQVMDISLWIQTNLFNRQR